MLASTQLNTKMYAKSLSRQNNLISPTLYHSEDMHLYSQLVVHKKIMLACTEECKHSSQNKQKHLLQKKLK